MGPCNHHAKYVIRMSIASDSVLTSIVTLLTFSKSVYEKMAPLSVFFQRSASRGVHHCVTHGHAGFPFVKQWRQTLAVGLNHKVAYVACDACKPDVLIDAKHVGAKGFGADLPLPFLSLSFFLSAYSSLAA